jgi:hypothetical protein
MVGLILNMLVWIFIAGLFRLCSGLVEVTQTPANSPPGVTTANPSFPRLPGGRYSLDARRPQTDMGLNCRLIQSFFFPEPTGLHC